MFKKGQPRSPNAGRKAGIPNKAKAELRDLAQVYTTEALSTLADIMRNGKQEPARVAAANCLLDRGYGKPIQSIDATHRIETVEELSLDELFNIAGRGRTRSDPAAPGPSESTKLH